MFARKTGAQTGTGTTAITLAADDGTPMGTFPPEIVESFRHMLTALSYQSTLPQAVAVTSALQHEGVTYTTLAMAATLATDTVARICMIELNWWTPGLQNYLGHGLQTSGGMGLADVLAGQATLDDVLAQTSLPNLTLLPAGSIPIERRSSIARSEQLQLAIAELRTRFDHVFLDVPSAAITSDTIALVALGDAVCLVVRQGVTPSSIVRQTLDQIKHVPVLGIVLNQVRYSVPRWMRNVLVQE